MSCVIHKFRMVHLLATPVQSASAFWWWCWVPVSMRHLKRSETPNRWRSGPVYENKPFREHYPERTGDGRGPRGGISGLYTLTLTLTAQFFNEVIVANGLSHRTAPSRGFFSTWDTFAIRCTSRWKPDCRRRLLAMMMMNNKRRARFWNPPKHSSQSLQ